MHIKKKKKKKQETNKLLTQRNEKIKNRKRGKKTVNKNITRKVINDVKWSYYPIWLMMIFEKEMSDKISVRVHLAQ